MSAPGLATRSLPDLTLLHDEDDGDDCIHTTDDEDSRSLHGPIPIPIAPPSPSPSPPPERRVAPPPLHRLERMEWSDDHPHPLRQTSSSLRSNDDIQEKGADDGMHRTSCGTEYHSANRFAAPMQSHDDDLSEDDATLGSLSPEETLHYDHGYPRRVMFDPASIPTSGTGPNKVGGATTSVTGEAGSTAAGGPGTFSVHHPERQRSDYSIHSAPELDYHDAGYIDNSLANSPEMIDDDEEEDDGDDNSTFPSPSSPSSPSVEFPVRRKSHSKRFEALQRMLPYTLWDYLQEEVLSVEVDGEQGVKSERVTNFLTVPGELERIIMFGVVICLDSFLYTFTILPLRTLVALWNLALNAALNALATISRRSRPRRFMRLSHKCDLTKAAILVGAMVALHRITDASKMYHSVRGQDTIKLYVLFNVLEIADRLCCSFGQDLQDSLFSRQTLGRRVDGSHPHIRPLALFGLTTVYVVAHTLVLFYQLVTLNVAINSYENALLTLLLSNQFVEIKGSVFKKFEKENLFQLTCADIVERFQLGIMLCIIALRNLIELSSTSALPLFPFLASFPTSISQLPSSLTLLQTIFSPAFIVLMSECFVDWLKHAFITKFNHIRPQVYGRYIDVLCKDLVVGARGVGGEQPFVDQSPVVARRLGFAALPLGCLVVRIIAQALQMLVDDSAIDECALPIASSGSGAGILTRGGEDWWSDLAAWTVAGLVALIGWICLVALKLLIGINLRAFASERWSSMAQREVEDQLNDRGRAKIGVTMQEASMDKETEYLLKNDVFDANERGRKISLASLSRYDMIKSRLW